VLLVGPIEDLDVRVGAPQVGHDEVRGADDHDCQQALGRGVPKALGVQLVQHRDHLLSGRGRRGWVRGWRREGVERGGGKGRGEGTDQGVGVEHESSQHVFSDDVGHHVGDAHVRRTHGLTGKDKHTEKERE
jgi:hypothetical protein